MRGSGPFGELTPNPLCRTLDMDKMHPPDGKQADSMESCIRSLLPCSRMLRSPSGLTRDGWDHTSSACRAGRSLTALLRRIADRA